MLRCWELPFLHSTLQPTSKRATAVEGFLGKQTQTIPAYSSARVDGKHLYEYARAGEEVELPTKKIEVFSIEVSDITRAGTTVDVTMTVHCSVGTYVRALADDIGKALGVGGYLHSLRRTGAGETRERP